MVQMIVILICLAAVIMGFFSVLWSWLILGVPSAFLLVTLFALKQKKWKYVPELSERANQMLQEFGHYYVWPFAGRDFSASASTLALATIAVAIIGAFKGFWWGIGIGIINFCLMYYVSVVFNPTNFLSDKSVFDSFDQKAHKEVIAHITRKL